MPASRMVRLHHELRGNQGKPTLVLVRGLARTHRHWTREFLDAVSGSFRLFLVDNRGVGQSPSGPIVASTADMADDLARAMTEAGIDRAHVFGMSLGGMIVQELALRHGRRVERLALGCTRASPRSAGGVSWSALSTIAKGMLAGAEASVGITAPLIVGERFAASHPEVLEEWRALAKTALPSRRGVVTQIVAAMTHDTRARLAGLSMPTLVVTGTDDRLIPSDASDDLAHRIPGARLVRIAGGPHDFATAFASETARILEDFFLARR